MVGELAHARCGVVAARLLYALGHTAVKPSPACDSDLLIQAVLDQGVAEAVAACDIGQLPDEGRSRSGLEHVDEVAFGHVGHSSQQVEVKVATDDAGRRQDRTRGLAETGDAGQQHLAHAPGKIDRAW